MMRLNKFLSEAGVASRRGSEEIIRSRRITINGSIPEVLGIKVDPDKDIIRLDGRQVHITQRLVYCMLNKPRGYLTTVTDTHGRKTVMDLLKDIPERVYPVGRLDVDTEGLLLITNDGDLSFALTHPRFKIEKEYNVTITGQLSQGQVRKLESGINIEGRLTAPAIVKIKSTRANQTVLSMTIREGRKRQIRYMFREIGFRVDRLIRLRIGPLELGDLMKSKWRDLSDKEVTLLKHTIHDSH